MNVAPVIVLTGLMLSMSVAFADDSKFKRLSDRIQKLERSACAIAECPDECRQDFVLLNADLASLQAKEARLRVELLNNSSNVPKTEAEVKAELDKFAKRFDAVLNDIPHDREDRWDSLRVRQAPAASSCRCRS